MPKLKDNSPTATAMKIIQMCLLVISVLLWAFTSYCYWRRPDDCTAITLWPVWVWILPGVMLAILGCWPDRRIGMIVSLMWLIQIGAFAEEPRSMLRSLRSPNAQYTIARQQGTGLRVITLNCAGGSIEAASEISIHKPDIVLLQESPTRKQVEEVGRRIFGKGAGILCGPDASIIARGQVRPIKLNKSLSSFFSAANVHLNTGMELYVVSTRLLPPTLRLDLFSPDSWKAEKENRLLHKEQVRQISEQIDRFPGNAPIVLGGDLNAPAGDGAFLGFRPQLHDAFAEGGRGWGNTVLNDIPVQRIDQIWTSSHLQAVSVTARKTQHSDHRMLIADLMLRR